MIWIRHRCNSIADLKRLQPADGAEIDLRADPASPGRLYLAHDPWSPGEDFEMWLRAFRESGCSGPLILNTKEDGLEERVLELLRQEGVTNFFFLDTAFPTLVRRSGTESKRLGERHFAIRISRYEPVQPELFQTLAAEWAWVDCFGAEPLTLGDLASLPSRVRVCLVSPELQQGSFEALKKFGPLVSRADAICTKKPEEWRKAFPELDA